MALGDKLKPSTDGSLDLVGAALVLGNKLGLAEDGSLDLVGVALMDASVGS